MRKLVSFIASALLFIGGVVLVIWAVIMWRKVGFQSGDPGPTDSNFFKMSVTMGVCAAVGGFLGMHVYSLEHRMAARKRRRAQEVSSGGRGVLFSSQFEGKKFFVDKVAAEALKEGISLSGAEKYMLEWTELEKGFLIDEKLSREFGEQTTDEDYEKKVRGLLVSAYESDVSSDPGMKKVYRDAYDALREGDHYILIMVNDALGGKLGRW